jgi:OOP family OmpA-OmpF porin
MWPFGHIGYDFVGPRVELEVGYGQLPTNVNIPGTAINGKVGQLTAMANVLYDFMPTSAITPYRRRRCRSRLRRQQRLAGQHGVCLPGRSSASPTTSNESMRFQVQGRYFGTTNPSVNTAFGNVSYQNQNFLTLAGVTSSA